jgi:hypothetical protein
MSAIDEVFERCAAERRAAFIPFIMAGDPDLGTTPALLQALAAAGADLIEVGIPFSDPIADGPVNQRAASRALASGTTVGGILEAVASVRDDLGVPIVLFTYFNPIRARGLEHFAEQAAASGVDGVLCVDLPPEEAAEAYLPALQKNYLDPIFVIGPDQHYRADEAGGRGVERLRLLRLANRGHRRAGASDQDPAEGGQAGAPEGEAARGGGVRDLDPGASGGGGRDRGCRGRGELPRPGGGGGRSGRGAAARGTRPGARGAAPRGAQEALGLGKRVPMSVLGAAGEEVKGTLTPGKLADVMVLDRDPFAFPPDEPGGRVVHEVPAPEAERTD